MQWPRSLYWRIATGIVALIAVVVVVQAAALLWLVARGDPDAERQSLMTRAMAAQLGEALRTDPDLDVAVFLRERSPSAPLFTARTNGRVDGVHPSDGLAASVLEDVKRLATAPATWAASDYHAAPIVVNGTFDGVVALVPRTPFQRYGPGVAAVVISVMLLGTILATALIVGPVRQRLHDLTRVARQLGAGDFSARAKQDGADEVTELAAAFNLTADELGARTAKLEASDAARRQLLADVSHELMTPVTTIRGYLETLAMPEVQLDLQTRTRYVAVARRETGRLERLIGDLLDMARLEAGGVDLDVADVSVADLFARVVGRHENECRSRHIELTCSIAPGAEVAFGDAFRLEQALANITANALRHSHDGGRIELRAERSDRQIVFVVADNGEGIGEEHLPLIFDRFYKAGRRKGETAGSGLGLYIVKTIVARHGGRVAAFSEVGRGTRIRMELPIPAEDRASGDLSGTEARPRADLAVGVTTPR